jgi:hypothetical protein
MILSGYDSVASSGLGFYRRGELGQMPVQVNPPDSIGIVQLAAAREDKDL